MNHDWRRVAGSAHLLTTRRWTVHTRIWEHPWSLWSGRSLEIGGWFL